MRAQHTPGPWSVGSSGRFLVCTLNKDVQVYADQMVRTEAEHDARLIAAAPDMYEALKHEAEWHEAQARTHKTLAQRNPGMVYDGLKEAWHKERAATLRAVLVKAEGKS